MANTPEKVPDASSKAIVLAKAEAAWRSTIAAHGASDTPERLRRWHHLKQLRAQQEDAS